MPESDPRGLQEELTAFRQRRQRPAIGGGRVRLFALGLGVSGGAIAYVLAAWHGGDDDGLRTSAVEAFQADRLSDRGRLEFPAIAEPVPDEALQMLPSEESGVSAELDRLRAELASLRSGRDADLDGLRNQNAALEEDLRAREASLTAELADRDAELADLQRRTEAEIAGLRNLIDSRSEDVAMPTRYLSPTVGDDTADRLEAEERERLAALDAETAALEAARIEAPAVVFAAGGEVRLGAGGPVPPGGYRRSGDEAFVDRGAPPLIVAEAERLTDPDRTLAQGTVIQVALQTAVNSDLPGNVVAVVSEPVPAFSGDRVLVPRGSRLFGQYRAGAALNQKRILILWTRILTPDGTSMQIASTGGDPLGRAGLAGDVDTKFVARFGGAALISIIGAAPALASRQSGDVVIAGTLEDVGDDLGEATESAVARQLDIAPTIRVAQGETVTVLVDRDVVIR